MDGQWYRCDIRAAAPVRCFEDYWYNFSRRSKWKRLGQASLSHCEEHEFLPWLRAMELVGFVSGMMRKHDHLVTEQADCLGIAESKILAHGLELNLYGFVFDYILATKLAVIISLPQRYHTVCTGHHRIVGQIYLACVQSFLQRRGHLQLLVRSHGDADGKNTREVKPTDLCVDRREEGRGRVANLTESGLALAGVPADARVSERTAHSCFLPSTVRTLSSGSTVCKHFSQSHYVATTSSMASAADIEQMNKVRVSLGMAPLPVPGQGPQFKDGDGDGDSNGDASESDSEDDMSTLEKRAAAAGKNWEKLEAEKRDKEERQRRKEQAKKERDRAAKFAKLEGKGLGDTDDENELDTRTWLLQQKKRQKKIEKTRKLEEELAERERLAQVDYTSKDLAGVKVGHEAVEFDEFAGEQILTLKDQDIGEDSEDDELENQELKAKEKLEEKLRLKKKRPDYDPTEQGEVQNVLSKYDEEIEGKKQKKFTLGGQGSTVEASRSAADDESATKDKRVKISLDILKEDEHISDYVDPATIKVKKPKKGKKEKKSRQKVADDDDTLPVPRSEVAATSDEMQVDHTEAMASRKRAFDFNDDDDLQAKLSEQRKQALKKRKKTDAAALARQLREEMPIDEAEPEEGGLIIDETSEFVANLKKPEEDEEEMARRARKHQTPNAASPDVKDEDEDGDTNLQSYAEAEEAEERAHRLKRETLHPAEQMTATGLEAEETMVGQGIGASLAMLRKRGLVGSSDSAEELAQKERQRAQFLADKEDLIRDFDNKAREQREADRRSGRFDKLSNREKDALARQHNEQREQFISRLLADKFNKEYKPDVKLRYNDEYGREMNQKEAFKHLSHMFHGKGSGKQKTEKRLKKIEDEKRSAAKGILNVGDLEGGFTNVQGREGKRQKTAGSTKPRGMGRPIGSVSCVSVPRDVDL
ncbi:hypothetical protein AC579_663 [Pseudocercospora musae]|uniref:SART-1 family protein n=1 Tax=Pseudocercospora musae TaxID=113226 RepID=A0A139IDN5_9PEZI|nr:hypothetical protein AC579_663 [Pseudocercospora musae]